MTVPKTSVILQAMLAETSTFKGLKAVGQFLPGCFTQVRKEYRAFALGKAMFRLIIGFTLPAICIALIVLLFALKEHSSGWTISQTTETSTILFFTIWLALGLCCVLVMPAFTAGMLTREREQETFDLLLLTRLTNAEIIFGKWISTLGICLLMICCVMPVTALSFLLGGVSPEQVLGAILLVISTSACLGALGMSVSSFCTRTPVALLLGYVFAVCWLSSLPFIICISAFPSILIVRFLDHTLSKFIRRESSRTFKLALICVFTFVFSILLAYILSKLDDEFFFFGNPIYAIDHFERSGNWYSGVEALFTPYFDAGNLGASLPAVLIMQTAGCITFLVLATRRMRQVRTFRRVTPGDQW